MVQMTSHSQARLHAARTFFEIHEAFQARDSNVFKALIGTREFKELLHYPADSVKDPQSGAGYFMHAHRLDGFGHFHTFIQTESLDEAQKQQCLHQQKSYLHLVGIELDAYGIPRQLFVPNQWVTGESWFPAEVVIDCLDRFSLDHAMEHRDVGRWLCAVLRMMRPDIERLLWQRDGVMAAGGGPNPDFFKNTEHELLAEYVFDMQTYLENLEKAGTVARALIDRSETQPFDEDAVMGTGSP